jgi:hypothetical protein
MAYRYFSHGKILKFHTVKTTTRSWKVQLQLPYGFCLKKNSANVETSKWTIWQVLN